MLMMNFAPIFAFFILARHPAHASTLKKGLMPPVTTSQILFDDDGNSHISNMECSEHNDNPFWDHWSRWTEAEDGGRFCNNNGTKECIFDFTNLATEGWFEYSGEIYRRSGGTLYIVDAVVTRYDGSSYTTVKDVAGCYSDCNTRLAMEELKSGLTPNIFATTEEREGCIWESMTTYTLEEIVNALEGNNDDLIRRLDLPEEFYWHHITGGRNITLQELSLNDTDTYGFASVVFE